jgi:hypothetical protein
MSCVQSLSASATAFDALGLTHSAEFARSLARDCAAISDTFGSDRAEALYRTWTSEIATRAAVRAKEAAND